jgi:hypothetical protein
MGSSDIVVETLGRREREQLGNRVHEAHSQIGALAVHVLPRSVMERDPPDAPGRPIAREPGQGVGELPPMLRACGAHDVKPLEGDGPDLTTRAVGRRIDDLRDIHAVTGARGYDTNDRGRNALIREPAVEIAKLLVKCVGGVPKGAGSAGRVWVREVRSEKANDRTHVRIRRINAKVGD